jgi:hypothetical protein
MPYFKLKSNCQKRSSCKVLRFSIDQAFVDLSSLNSFRTFNLFSLFQTSCTTLHRRHAAVAAAAPLSARRGPPSALPAHQRSMSCSATHGQLAEPRCESGPLPPPVHSASTAVPTAARERGQGALPTPPCRNVTSIVLQQCAALQFTAHAALRCAACATPFSYPTHLGISLPMW